MPTERLRVGQPPLGPPCAASLAPEADRTPESFSNIEGWGPEQLRGVKLARLGDGASGRLLLNACRAILTPDLSWEDVDDVCQRLLVASSTLSKPTRAKVSASEGCKAMACMPYDLLTIYECDTWIWGPTPIPAARRRYDELRKELAQPGAGEPCPHFQEWWTRKQRRAPISAPTQLGLF
jgi:hypothetical protein